MSSSMGNGEPSRAFGSEKSGWSWPSWKASFLTLSTVWPGAWRHGGMLVAGQMNLEVSPLTLAFVQIPPVLQNTAEISPLPGGRHYSNTCFSDLCCMYIRTTSFILTWSARSLTSVRQETFCKDPCWKIPHSFSHEIWMPIKSGCRALC